ARGQAAGRAGPAEAARGTLGESRRPRLPHRRGRDLGARGTRGPGRRPERRTVGGARPTRQGHRGRGQRGAGTAGRSHLRRPPADGGRRGARPAARKAVPVLRVRRDHGRRGRLRRPPRAHRGDRGRGEPPQGGCRGRPVPAAYARVLRSAAAVRRGAAGPGGGVRRASLTVMKGDLNYRRLTGDRAWPPVTPFGEVVAYFPGPLAALRTLKSDVVVGISPAKVAELDAASPSWRTDGSHALIQVRANRRS